ncbi:MAG: hypothetical protein OI74_13410 [Gammaproteobacteria bacterium (ex Lamellibrachia satsuma)]|nr:MAG: DcrB-related protein [Gammaproteobacteria bacterium (ex Lamellibrachia satsuma)]RRS31638.1 MAG: hypothetical protein OI74_13410 [Gammaproteobacteria bacterium (ex Lamellibrachia satsuma)]RRS36129.1 MAG: hypothetical protein NV67_08430 [Gammaproteobacteria bacterium (ex Lamellibrachia satsuma)]
MPKFQGSGFAVELPEQCIDASVYTFAFPAKGNDSPYMTIRVEKRSEAPDLKTLADQEMEALREKVEAFQLISQAAGKRSGCDGIMSSCEWGEGPARVRQKQLLIMQCGETVHLYKLTAVSLASNQAATDPLFDQIFRSFAPNTIQLP